MIIDEIVTVVSIVLSSFFVGITSILLIVVKDCFRKLEEYKIEMKLEYESLNEVIAKRVDDFDDITERASEANLSLGNKIIEMENKVLELSELVQMQNSNIKGPKTWGRM